MAKNKNLSAFLESFYNRKPVAVITSVLLAVVIWFTIAINVYTSSPRDFYNIPLQVDLNGTAAGENGLSVVSCDVEDVNVRLVGDRSQVGILKEENLTAYAEIGNINSAGEYTLQINIVSDTNIAFTVDTITPAHAAVKLDKIETRTFQVEASYPNIVVTSGHALDKEDVTIEPPTVEITGPSAQLGEIDRVVVYSDRAAEIDGSYSFYTNQIQFYTDKGTLLDTDHLEIPSVDYQISIPVLTTKELTLTCDLLGFPTDFDRSWFSEHLNFSPDTITLASQTNNSALSDRETWSVGRIPLSEIGLDFSRSFEIELDDEFINRSNFQQTTMTLDNSDLSSRTITVSSKNMLVTNKPANYDFKIVTRQLDVTVIGEKEAIEALEADDIVVTVDLFNYENAEQAPSFDQPASVSFLNQGRVWAFGSYRIALDRIDPVTETTDTTED